MTKLAIFDLDGTLIHFPFVYFFEETSRILKILGHPEVSRVDLEASFSSFDYFRVIDFNLKISWDSEEQFLSKFWTEFNWTHYPKAEVFQDTLTTLQALKESGYLLAIATARASTLDSLKSDLEHTGILPYFSSIKTRASQQEDWKDKSSQIALVLEELQVEARDAVMIGDIPADVESAQRISLGESYAVLTGGIRREVLEDSKPSKIFSSLTEVYRHMLK